MKTKDKKRLKKLVKRDQLETLASAVDQLYQIELQNQALLRTLLHDVQVGIQRTTPQERFDIFARMALIALQDLQMDSRGLTTVRVEAFSPPLADVPIEVLPKFAPQRALDDDHFSEYESNS